MKISIHHQPIAADRAWNIHVWQNAWDGNQVWDTAGTPEGSGVRFELPDLAGDPRKLSFKFRSSNLRKTDVLWEPDEFTRNLVASVHEFWTFEQSRRILTQDPFPAGLVFSAGDILQFLVLTKNRFRGGRIYAWNPYDASKPSLFFPESARNEAQGVSTFSVRLEPWMVRGFHLKLAGKDAQGRDVWEPDASNRVWRPADGPSAWFKSGQCDLRREALVPTEAPVEALIPASMTTAPSMILRDIVEDQSFKISPSSVRDLPGRPQFKVASYAPKIFPMAGYTLAAEFGESSPLVRPFPAEPADPARVSRLAVGASAWWDVFPELTACTLEIEPRKPSSFDAGLTVQVAVGNGPAFAEVAAVKGADGAWSAPLELLIDATTSIRLRPSAGAEAKLYEGLDTARFFKAPASGSGRVRFFTAEGVYGVSTRGRTAFAEPAGRADLMRAAFGATLTATGVLEARELPHGATSLNGEVFFVVHAPHAVWAALILVDEQRAGGPARTEVPMALTPDGFYWWCAVPSAGAPAGARYRFLFNDDLEVIDPAAREVLDTGSFLTRAGEDPRDPATSWGRVVDVGAIRAAARRAPWRTLGWEKLLWYEIHASRFTDANPRALPGLELLAELVAAPDGHLASLPVTALGLLPVQEFNSAVSWGYDPAFYFAIDGHYGGPAGMAKFVDAAHRSGRGVLVDVVYNHSLGSSLVKIAPDVYRNGDYDGDQMNCGHTMTREFLRQATLYLWQTFGVDGFRFDDTQHIVQHCPGGWEFLGMIRSAVRAAAAAEGQPWPICVAENHATQPWDISNPGFGVMDGEWGIDEVFRLRDASYNLRDGRDDSGRLKAEMDNPSYWGRPFFQAIRFGESHDMVSGQDAANLRIAARAAFGQGLRLAKALGALTLLSNGTPMLFMGQEGGETQSFSFDNQAEALNLAQYSKPPNARVLAWFRQLMGLRNDPAKGLQGDANEQNVRVGRRTVGFTCGRSGGLFAVVTYGTPDTRQDSSWLGLPAGAAYKEIFNSSWPVFQVEGEPEAANGGFSARIHSGDILNLPFIGAVVLERV